ncbi:MAG TPA: hypothetical protein VH062_35640 [Polyangiaceae bacterium]|jgi:hypothetical protein|nr:hypothetical protein [Polyangiaceae bacterium]
MNFAETIVELKDVAIASGKNPTKLHVPVALELELEGCPGLDQSRFIVEGPRAFRHVLGLRLVWGAGELAVT